MPVHLPSGKWLVYQHSKSSSGLGIISLGLISIAMGAFMGAIHGAAATALSGGSAGIIGKASTSLIKALNIFKLGFVNVIHGYEAGALAGGEMSAFGSLLTDTGCFGACGGGQSARRGLRTPVRSRSAGWQG